MLLSQNASSLSHLLLYSDPKRIYSFSMQQANVYYLQGDSMDRYLTELKMLFFLDVIHFHMAFSLFLFTYSVLLSLICTYIKGVCNFLHLVLLAVSFFVINFLFT